MRLIDGAAKIPIGTWSANIYLSFINVGRTDLCLRRVGSHTFMRHGDAYAIFRLAKEYQFQSKEECLDGLRKYFDAIEVSGSRNARFECSLLEGGK